MSSSSQKSVKPLVTGETTSPSINALPGTTQPSLRIVRPADEAQAMPEEVQPEGIVPLDQEEPQEMQLTSGVSEPQIRHSQLEDFSEAEAATFKLRAFAMLIDMFFFGSLTQLFNFLLKKLYLQLAVDHAVMAFCLAEAVNVTLMTYYFAWPLSEWGQTLGKKLMGIKVVSTKGIHPELSLWHAWVREILAKSVSWFTVAGFLTPLWRKDGKALHDRLAKTRVVKIESDELA